MSSLLNRSYLELSNDKIFLDEDYEKEISVERLNTDIREGYWLCVFFCCVDYYMFTWFSTLEEALNSYLSLTQEDLCGEKLLFYIANGSINNIKVDGDYEI